jgi:Hemingway/CFA97
MKTRAFAAPQSTQTANMSQLLLMAQEQKCLASKLMNLRPRVDNKEPQRYCPINHNRGANSAFRQREIDNENSMLLKKMLNIIKRKNSSMREGGVAALVADDAAPRTSNVVAGE